MKLFLICLLQFCGLVFAQNATTQVPVPPSNCYLGDTKNGEGNIIQVACNFAQQSCMTKVDSQNNLVQAVRECTQTLACENNAAGNSGKCYPGQNNIRICVFCCRGHLCNNSTEIPELS